jgi:hypothetical protein
MSFAHLEFPVGLSSDPETFLTEIQQLSDSVRCLSSAIPDIIPENTSNDNSYYESYETIALKLSQWNLPPKPDSEEKDIDARLEDTHDPEAKIRVIKILFTLGEALFEASSDTNMAFYCKLDLERYQEDYSLCRIAHFRGILREALENVASKHADLPSAHLDELDSGNQDGEGCTKKVFDMVTELEEWDAQFTLFYMAISGK